MMKPQMWEPGMDDEEEIDILDLLGYYMSKLPLLIAAVVIGVLMVGFYSFYQQSKAVDSYTAKSKIYVFLPRATLRPTSPTSTRTSSISADP